VVQVDGPAAGFLVLTDLWYPGWRCTIDGQPERLYRANFLFRATAVPAGRHEVIFTMEPRRYALGRTISLGGLAALVGITCFSILPTSPQRKQGQPALPRWQAGLVLTAVLLLIAYGIALAFSDADRTASAGPAMRGPEGADLELHRAVLRRVHAGESYYLTARAEMRHRDFPTRSPFNFRLPTLTWFLAQLPDPAWGQALLLGLAGVTLLLWLGVLTRDGVGLFGRAVGGLLLTGPLLLCRGEEGMVFPELWAGVGIALSLALHALGWWRAAVGCGLAALCVRELALPYVLVMLLAAAWEGRRREAVVWTLGLAGFAVYLFLHAARVWSLQEEIDRAGASWLGLGGWPFVLATARWNAYLADAPAWVAAVSVPLALLGLVTWHGPHGTRAALTVGAYVSLFLLLGRPDNHYWGLLYGPLLPLGLVGVPAAIQRLGARYRT
jgi:hypothetical protein